MASHNVVLTCVGVLEAHALETDTIKLSVVAVNQAIVVKSLSNGCFQFKAVCKSVWSDSVPVILPQVPHPVDILSILSLIAFLVGTSLLPFQLVAS